jgi:hypothetical protein
MHKGDRRSDGNEKKICSNFVLNGIVLEAKRDFRLPPPLEPMSTGISASEGEKETNDNNGRMCI